jgi:hypothetical protein
MKDFRSEVETRFGSSFFAKRAYRNFDNDFRQMVLLRRKPSYIETTTTTTKDSKGKDATSKTERRVPADNQPAIDFLKRFTALMKEAYDKTSGSKARKVKAGAEQGLAYLDSFNMPSDRSAGIYQKADEIVGDFPQKAEAALAATVSLLGTITSATTEAVVKTYNDVGAWIDREHDELEARNNREGWRAGLRRWYRSLR